MDMNNAFDEILKIQGKLDKNNTVNPKITVAGKECTLYHTGNKPSASDVGAVPLAGNTKDTATTGAIRLGNNKFIDGVLADDSNVASLMGLDSNDNAIFGGIYKPTIIRSSNNPSVMVGSNTYTMYHTGNKPKTVENCARSFDTGNTNTNKYFKLATFTITDNYGSVSAEYSIGFNGHGMATSPHHKLGVWVKRQDSTFNMDLKVWGAINNEYAKYVLVKTGTYQATLYAVITIQYCTLYMSCVSRMLNSATVEYYTGADPITSIGDIQSWGTYMDKPSVIGANTTIFAGVIGASAISETLINMSTCVNSSGIITLSNNTIYRVSGSVHNKKNLYLYNSADKTQKFTLLSMTGLTLGANDYLPFCRTFKTTGSTTWFLADENQARPDWTQVTIEKINGGN